MLTASLSLSGISVGPSSGVGIPLQGMLVAIPSPAPTPSHATFQLRLSEGYASAFKTLGVPTVTPASAQVEDGFPTPPSGVNGGGATQATRFLLRFFNLPAGVSLSAPGAVHGHATGGPSGARLSLTRVLGADSSGAGGILSSDPHFSPVAAPSGFAFVVYEVVGSNAFAVENVNVPFVLTPWPGGLPSMSVTLAPVSTIATSDGPAPEPRFGGAASTGGG